MTPPIPRVQLSPGEARAVDRHLDRLLADRPPLTDEQRDRLRALLAPPPGDTLKVSA